MFSIKVNGIERVISKLQAVPKGIMPALGALVKYINDALKKPEPYKYVSRKAAYGKTFFSDKQRKWFFANGGAAMIGNHRTGATSGAWTYTPIANGYRVSNPTQGAYYTRSDSGQARQPGRVGWLKVKEKIEKNWTSAVSIFRSVMKHYLDAK